MTVVALQLSYRNAMPHMEEVPHNNEEYGTYNPSFSLPDNPGIYTHQDLPASRGPIPPTTTAAPDTSFIPTETVHSPVILNNNVLTPTKTSTSSPTFQQAPTHLSPTQSAQDAPKVNPCSSPDSTTALPNTSPSPPTHDSTTTPPITRSDSQNTQTTTNNDPAEPVTSPTSQSSIPCSHTRIASAEIDKPFCKPRVKTPPYSPLLPSPLPKQVGTPPTTPDHAPFIAKLVHIDTSPLDTPVTKPQQTSMTLSAEEDQQSTSLDQTDEAEHPHAASDAGSPSQDRRPSTISGNTQDCCQAEGVDDDGFLGDEDADKNSEGEEELESDEEELLRVMARCNPIFLTFSKWWLCYIAGIESDGMDGREWRRHGEDGWHRKVATGTSSLPCGFACAVGTHNYNTYCCTIYTM